MLDIIKIQPEILIKRKNWINPRRLTPKEAKYLMGFQDRYALNFGHNKGFDKLSQTHNPTNSLEIQ